jgi:hypothetical protein
MDPQGRGAVRVQDRVGEHSGSLPAGVVDGGPTRCRAGRDADTVEP